MKRRRHAYRPPRRRTPSVSGATGAPKSNPPRPHSRASAAAEPISINLLRIIVCGAIFVSLVTLKLVLPDGMAGVRGTLGTWLVRDADFVSAFSAVGHAVSGEGGVIDSLENAYVAVFGDKEATEVSGAAEVKAGDGEESAGDEESIEDADGGVEARAEPSDEPRQAGDYPEQAAAEQRVLGFDYAAPLTGTVTSPFGWREHPTSGREAFHYGVDIGADEGIAISCFADGTVGVVGDSTELGKYLTIHHQNGVTTLYGHCSRITVSSGETVKCGDKIAEVGSTGNATGPHLHFEIHDGEDYLDPTYYLS